MREIEGGAEECNGSREMDRLGRARWKVRTANGVFKGGCLFSALCYFLNKMRADAGRCLPRADGP